MRYSEGNVVKRLESEERKSKFEERKLKFIEANMKFEGFCISDKSKEDCRKILKGEISGDEVVLSCLCRYKKEL